MKYEIITAGCYRVSDLPSLTIGSAKQISWAEDIRARAMSRILEGLAKLAQRAGNDLEDLMDKAPPFGPTVRQVVEAIAARQDAKFWIDECQSLGDSVAVKMLVSKIARTL